MRSGRAGQSVAAAAVFALASVGVGGNQVLPANLSLEGCSRTRMWLDSHDCTGLYDRSASSVWADSSKSRHVLVGDNVDWSECCDSSNGVDVGKSSCPSGSLLGSGKGLLGCALSDAYCPSLWITAADEEDCKGEFTQIDRYTWMKGEIKLVSKNSDNDSRRDDFGDVTFDCYHAGRISKVRGHTCNNPELLTSKNKDLKRGMNAIGETVHDKNFAYVISEYYDIVEKGTGYAFTIDYEAGSTVEVIFPYGGNYPTIISSFSMQDPTAASVRLLSVHNTGFTFDIVNAKECGGVHGHEKVHFLVTTFYKVKQSSDGQVMYSGHLSGKASDLLQTNIPRTSEKQLVLFSNLMLVRGSRYNELLEVSPRDSTPTGGTLGAMFARDMKCANGSDAVCSALPSDLEYRVNFLAIETDGKTEGLFGDAAKYEFVNPSEPVTSRPFAAFAQMSTYKQNVPGILRFQEDQKSNSFSVKYVEDTCNGRKPLLADDGSEFPGDAVLFIMRKGIPTTNPGSGSGSSTAAIAGAAGGSALVLMVAGGLAYHNRDSLIANLAGGSAGGIDLEGAEFEEGAKETDGLLENDDEKLFE